MRVNSLSHIFYSTIPIVFTDLWVLLLMDEDECIRARTRLTPLDDLIRRVIFCESNVQAVPRAEGLT